MARAGRKDRGLLARKDTDGKIVGWTVRLWHEGRERRFGTFPTKTEARDFYEKAKQEQRDGRFFPERYQHGGYAKLHDVIESHMASNTNKTAQGDRHYADFWIAWFPGATLRTVTPEAIEKAKHHLTGKGLAAQTVAHYLKFLRHVLNIAARDGKLERNPLAKVAFPKLHKGSLRFLSLEEEGRLCAAMGPTYAPWVRLAILTGLRRQEQFSLSRADDDL